MAGKWPNRYPDYKAEKTEMIEYVVNELSVPRENITVILVPINKDQSYSYSRRFLNKFAREHFESLGVHVHDEIIGGKEDFAGDGFHVKAWTKEKGTLAFNSAKNLVSRNIMVGDVEGAPPVGPINQDPKKKDPSRLTPGVEVPYSYVQEKLGVSKVLWDIYRTEMHKVESQAYAGISSYGAIGGAGKHYDGRYQLGKLAKLDAAKYLGINRNSPDTKPDKNGLIKYPIHHDSESRKQFRENPNFQERMLGWHSSGQ
jgi:hypothetical protein